MDKGRRDLAYGGLNRLVCGRDLKADLEERVVWSMDQWGRDLAYSGLNRLVCGRVLKADLEERAVWSMDQWGRDLGTRVVDLVVDLVMERSMDE